MSCLAPAGLFQSAPRRARGRQPESQVESQRCFKSAPPPARGRPGRARPDSGPGFNPRPARVGGATWRGDVPSGLKDVSIRAPPARAGRLADRSISARSPSLFQSAPRPRGRGDVTAGRARRSPRSLFQSAPRPRGRGDLVVGGLRAASDEFQSAPRPRGRGDLHDRDVASAAMHVSIRAPPARAGRRKLMVSRRCDAVSIRAPPVRGATGRWPRRTSVSIRAPPAWRGDCAAADVASQFQSAPRPRGRGDVVACLPSCGVRLVSIRAPPARAGRLVRRWASRA